MWRATVIERIQDGRVVVSIPALYRGDPIGPMQSAVDAQVGDAVVVADLVAEARVTDWWVVGYESQIGRWGAPYPHEHPIGQVTAVDTNGQPTTLTAILAQKADKADIPGAPDTSGYATKTELSEGLATKANTSALTAYATTTALATKAGGPGAWTACIPSTYLTNEGGADIEVRQTDFGVQIRAGRWRMATTVPMDAVLFTLPAGFTPSIGTFFSFSGMSSPATSNTAMQIHVEVRTTRAVTMRQAISNGPLFTLGHTLYIS